MAIATTFTAAYYARQLGLAIYGLYFTVLGFIVIRGNEELDVAKEIQDFMIMTQEHVTVLEGGPLTYRILAIIIDMFFVTEE